MRNYRIGFLIFQNVGHVTHDQRMRAEVAKHPEIQPEWMPILPWNKDRWQRLPVIKNNQTLLCGFRAKDQLRCHNGSFDALYCHTQEAALVIRKYMKKVPTILSVDATPINLSSLGQTYRRKSSFGAMERVKHFLIRRSYEPAAHFVTFSNWAKESLIADYGVAEQRITVNAPGLDLGLWNISEEERARSQHDLPHVLFVGGDFGRKGGDTLVQCATSMGGKWAVDIVTSAPAPSALGIPNLRFHCGLKTGSPELISLYHNADIFALPTRGDSWGWAIMEAMAMRLPVVTTPVGGIPELVIHGETGLLIPPNSPEALTEAIQALAKNPERRRAMGTAGRQRVEKYFDGTRSYSKLIDLIKAVADRERPHP
jgi:glycosyltransferase involved in cell wall biosynthesis